MLVWKKWTYKSPRVAQSRVQYSFLLRGQLCFEPACGFRCNRSVRHRCKDPELGAQTNCFKCGCTLGVGRGRLEHMAGQFLDRSVGWRKGDYTQRCMLGFLSGSCSRPLTPLSPLFSHLSNLSHLSHLSPLSPLSSLLSSISGISRVGRSAVF